MIEDKIKYNDYWERVQEKDKEIERLQAELDKTRLSELNKEYIINELEEYMIGKDIYKILLYKLRDLKESEKE